MTSDQKTGFSLRSFIRKNWADPVWSKVFASIIIAIGGGVLGFIWVCFQSFALNISFAKALQQFFGSLSRSTPVNNIWLCLIGLLVVWLLFRAVVRWNRKDASYAAAAANHSSADRQGTMGPPIIERYGFHNTDTNLLSAFQAKAGSPITSIRTDGHYGEVMEFDVNMGPDDLDCFVGLAASKAKHVKYVYIPISGFIFYLRINVGTSNNKVVNSRWIALRLDRTAISAGTEQAEKAYPSSWVPMLGNWVASSYHIPTLVEETFGLEGWTYHSLVGFRIRGKGKLESITLS